MADVGGAFICVVSTQFTFQRKVNAVFNLQMSERASFTVQASKARPFTLINLTDGLPAMMISFKGGVGVLRGML